MWSVITTSYILYRPYWMLCSLSLVLEVNPSYASDPPPPSTFGQSRSSLPCCECAGLEKMEVVMCLLCYRQACYPSFHTKLEKLK